MINDHEYIIHEDIFKTLKKECLILTLVFNEYLNELALKYNFKYKALLNDDSFNKLNSILTAEGLISFIISHSDMPLYQSNILILGNGNCSKEIIKLLDSFDCYIDVGCRKFKKEFYNQIMISDINYQKYDYIINTIPYQIIKHKDIDTLNKDVIIFDIASYPYGLDHSYALSQNKQTYIISSIPALYAYKYEALYIKKRLEQNYL